jgi:hypothetical protein
VVVLWVAGGGRWVEGEEKGKLQQPSFVLIAAFSVSQDTTITTTPRRPYFGFTCSTRPAVPPMAVPRTGSPLEHALAQQFHSLTVLPEGPWNTVTAPSVLYGHRVKLPRRSLLHCAVIKLSPASPI